MKKKEDIKKHLIEEKHGLTPANLFYILLLLFLLPIYSFAQININGFGRTNIYNTLPGFSNILQLNFNGDEYSDIMLFDPSQKRFVIHNGAKDNTFSKPIDKFFFYSISNIKFLQSRKTEQNLFLFVSRSERKVGLTSFTKYGTLQLLNLRDLDSYPSNISVADIDLDGNKEALISGPAFNGLSILTLNNLSLKENKIITKRSFVNAEFFDLNFDDYPDIIAIDLLDNSLKFLINNREGKFVETRTNNFFGKITDLKICNINNDDFSDISFLQNNLLVVLLGDSVASFENKIEFKFSYKPAAYEITDLNNDEITDIIALNKAKDRIEIYYRKDEIELPKPNFILDKKNITTFKILQRGKAKRLAAVSSAGELFVVGKVLNSQKSFSFAAGSFAKLFTQSSKTNFIIYRNKNDVPALNILSGNQNQKFQYLSTVPLLYNYENFVAEDQGAGNYNFYLFSNKSLELISLSEFDYSIEKKIFTPYAQPIDIRTVEDKQIESKFVHLLFVDNGKLGIENIEVEKDNIISQGIDIIDSSVVNAIISNGEFEEIHFWKLNDSLLTFNSLRQYEDVRINFSSEEIEIEPGQKPEISFSFIGAQNKNLISQVNYGDKTSFYFYDGKKFSRFTIIGKQKRFNFILPEMLASVKSQKGYILYDKLSGAFKKVEFNLRDKKISITNYIESKGVNGYFVSQFLDNNNYLFYTNTDNNFITIKNIE